MKLIGIWSAFVVLVIAGVVAIKVANSSRTPEAEVRKFGSAGCRWGERGDAE